MCRGAGAVRISKMFWKFVILVIAIEMALARSAMGAVITTAMAPAWIESGNAKSRLQDGKRLAFGDHISTGPGGYVDIKLDSGMTARLQANSSMTLGQRRSANAAQVELPEIQLRSGTVCTDYHSSLNPAAELRLDIDRTVMVRMYYPARLCAVHKPGRWVVHLLDGSLRIVHAMNSDTIILSEVGTQYVADDSGDYQLLSVGEEIVPAEAGPEANRSSPAPGKPVPAIGKAPEMANEGAGTAIKGTQRMASDRASEQTSRPATRDTLPDSRATPGNTQTSSPDGKYIYTVHLFSSRSQERAVKVNRRLQAAGHRSEVSEYQLGDNIIYRVSVPAFNSHQAALAFSESIKGTLGIADTWISRSPRQVP